jgi:hypothetical protein
MTLSELIPWLAMATSIATILILPLLSDGPPALPSGQKKQGGTANIYFSRIFW